MANFLCLGPRTMYWVLKMAGVLGAIGSGVYSCFQMMWQYENIRLSIIHFYVTLFSVFILSAEFEILEHPWTRKLGMFLTRYIGRAIFYIFIGGLLLEHWGFVPGVWMIAAGVLNVLVLCMCKDQLDGKAAADATVPQTPGGSTAAEKPSQI